MKRLLCVLFLFCCLSAQASYFVFTESGAFRMAASDAAAAGQHARNGSYAYYLLKDPGDAAVAAVDTRASAFLAAVPAEAGDFTTGWASLDEPTQEVYLASAASLFEELYAARSALDQSAKPVDRKIMENLFYQLIGQVLIAVGDPRADDEQIPKLGFPEITALVEVVQVADPMAAINFSLKLLTVDAALKRYDLLWWDTVTQHVLE